MPRPRRLYTCPACQVSFEASNAMRDGRPGKLCPNNHWYPVHQLAAFTTTGKLPTSRIEVANPEPAPSVAPPPAPLPAPMPALTARHALTVMGIGERTHQLALALEWMLHSYDALVATLPAQSLARRMVEGSFGTRPDLCREILEL